MAGLYRHPSYDGGPGLPPPRPRRHVGSGPPRPPPKVSEPDEFEAREAEARIRAFKAKERARLDEEQKRIEEKEEQKRRETEEKHQARLRRMDERMQRQQQKYAQPQAGQRGRAVGRRGLTPLSGRSEQALPASAAEESAEEAHVAAPVPNRHSGGGDSPAHNSESHYGRGVLSEGTSDDVIDMDSIDVVAQAKRRLRERQRREQEEKRREQEDKERKHKEAEEEHKARLRRLKDMKRKKRKKAEDELAQRERLGLEEFSLNDRRRNGRSDVPDSPLQLPTPTAAVPLVPAVGPATPLAAGQEEAAANGLVAILGEARVDATLMPTPRSEDVTPSAMRADRGSSSSPSRSRGRRPRLPDVRIRVRQRRREESRRRAERDAAEQASRERRQAEMELKAMEAHKMVKERLAQQRRQREDEAAKLQEAKAAEDAQKAEAEARVAREAQRAAAKRLKAQQAAQKKMQAERRVELQLQSEARLAKLEKNDELAAKSREDAARRAAERARRDKSEEQKRRHAEEEAQKVFESKRQQYKNPDAIAKITGKPIHLKPGSRAHAVQRQRSVPSSVDGGEASGAETPAAAGNTPSSVSTAKPARVSPRFVGPSPRRPSREPVEGISQKDSAEKLLDGEDDSTAFVTEQGDSQGSRSDDVPDSRQAGADGLEQMRQQILRGLQDKAQAGWLEGLLSKATGGYQHEEGDELEHVRLGILAGLQAKAQEGELEELLLDSARSRGAGRCYSTKFAARIEVETPRIEHARAVIQRGLMAAVWEGRLPALLAKSAGPSTKADARGLEDVRAAIVSGLSTEAAEGRLPGLLEQARESSHPLEAIQKTKPDVNELRDAAHAALRAAADTGALEAALDQAISGRRQHGLSASPGQALQKRAAPPDIVELRDAAHAALRAAVGTGALEAALDRATNGRRPHGLLERPDQAPAGVLSAAPGSVTQLQQQIRHNLCEAFQRGELNADLQRAIRRQLQLADIEDSSVTQLRHQVQQHLAAALERGDLDAALERGARRHASKDATSITTIPAARSFLRAVLVELASTDELKSVLEKAMGHRIGTCSIAARRSLHKRLTTVRLQPALTPPSSFRQLPSVATWLNVAAVSMRPS
eukprot:TRINITY_DN3948_c0_g1_i1.p1 TRINITY_DN3948_c0_g1~~TRINITY_DN3948_c0_g1_i1.p1  ORF type:complete len:1108 (-),score=283.82 TRINITY_DN3948_c0_g1_i1:47-3370(-)